jgi:flagellin-like hook-associated protein FlgL
MASGITINSNLAAMNAQRRLGQSTQSVQQSFTRLSSGLRINKASDDAAGLAISESLNVDARVYTQGIRNLNDGISLTNIAEGAMQELTNITIRQRELATQSANGTLSLKQRQALNQEANVLVDEFNRIVSTTDFNSTKLLDNSSNTLRMQAGYGASGGITFAIGDELARTVGDGTFNSALGFTTGSNPYDVTLGDLNGDARLDMITADWATASASVFIGNGDGTFNTSSKITIGTNARTATLGDLNGDHVLDLVSTVISGGGYVSVLIGNGNGTFSAASTMATASNPLSMSLSDLNSDGALDIVAANWSASSASVFLGNGNGTFHANTPVTICKWARAITFGDLNNDNVPDMVVVDESDSQASVLFGNGDGTFKASQTFASGSSPKSVILGDLNGDGLLDMATADYGGSVSLLFGNGDGTFKARTTLNPGGGPWSVKCGDLNGDGLLDIVSADRSGNKVSVFIGNGDGTFKANQPMSTSSGPQSVALGDLTGDGVLDLATADFWSAQANVLVAHSAQVSTSPYLNLCTRQGALDAMATIDATLQRISSELGSLGSIQSRLGVAVNTLSVSRENYLSAKSQITDADVAQESAQLLKNQILQQAGAAVLAQANQAPALALMLLRSE